MTFKAGKEHHGVLAVSDAKAKVIAYVATGTTVQAAMAAVGKKPDTVRIWLMRDPIFAADLAKAKEDGAKQSFDALGLKKESIAFADFSKMFLDQTDFPHKSITVETLNFCDELIESLRASKITNLSELKKVLEIRSEQIKKLMQNQ